MGLKICLFRYHLGFYSIDLTPISANDVTKIARASLLRLSLYVRAEMVRLCRYILSQCPLLRRQMLNSLLPLFSLHSIANENVKFNAVTFLWESLPFAEFISNSDFSFSDPATSADSVSVM